MKTVITQKLTPEEAELNIKGIEQWFKDNPNRRMCRTDLWKVRRGHVREDVMKHAKKANSSL